MKRTTGRELRSMKEPGTAYDDDVLGKDPQPGHMKEYVKTDEDNGGVHINSGIPNRAFYEVAIRIGGNAWAKAGKIWYVTLRDKLRPRSTFKDAARLTKAAATELYGKGSLEVKAVREGWSAVGNTGMRLANMRIVVTGGAGFVGSHVVEELERVSAAGTSSFRDPMTCGTVIPRRPTPLRLDWKHRPR